MHICNEDIKVIFLWSCYVEYLHTWSGFSRETSWFVPFISAS